MQKTSFPKEYVKNADLHKSVLNKVNDHTRIMRKIHLRSFMLSAATFGIAKCVKFFPDHP